MTVKKPQGKHFEACIEYYNRPGKLDWHCYCWIIRRQKEIEAEKKRLGGGDE